MYLNVLCTVICYTKLKVNVLDVNFNYKHSVDINNRNYFIFKGYQLK